VKYCLKSNGLVVKVQDVKSSGVAHDMPPSINTGWVEMSLHELFKY
jgi:hypothetical protein